VRIATAKLDEDFTLPQTTVVFSGFDPKGTGKFNVYDLKDTARDLGEDLTDDEIERIFKAADLDNDGYVSAEDFYNIVTKKPFK
jgi:Ca2+-binding EF-hand superfamily protein